MDVYVGREPLPPRLGNGLPLLDVIRFLNHFVKIFASVVLDLLRLEKGLKLIGDFCFVLVRLGLRRDYE